MDVVAVPARYENYNIKLQACETNKMKFYNCCRAIVISRDQIKDIPYNCRD